LQQNIFFSTLGASESCKSLSIIFYNCNTRPHLPYYVTF
jgi:hypothetical protein